MISVYPLGTIGETKQMIMKYVVTQAGNHLYSTTWDLLGYLSTGNDLDKAVLLDEGDARMIARLLNDVDGFTTWHAIPRDIMLKYDPSEIDEYICNLKIKS